MSDYKSTLHLPNTAFAMRANLAQREPEMLRHWQSIDVYTLMIDSAGNKGSYLLHDGPPYANGDLHMGHALNKTIKDIVVKAKNLQGFKANYTPGWDCHGLPIELKVEQQLSEKKKDLPQNVIRKLCREYAAKYVGIQKEQFKRLGVLGTWDDPYLTMNPEYEAATAHTLAEFVEKGNVIRNKKPIHWCCSCKTALAEAEVEYADHTSPSIYVRFPVQDPDLAKVFPKSVGSAVSIVIWTTTPWTLPCNMAVAVHPELEYSLVEYNDAKYILASELVEKCAEKFSFNAYTILETCLGKDLENIVAQHPFYDRPSPIILGEHVTIDTGTGCVHTAPGHGREDYEVGLKYNLEIYSPMNDSCQFLDNVELVGGLSIQDANPVVIEKLQELNKLLALDKISHSYPHCWRCKKPVVFRATTQWFITMEGNDLRKKALKAIRNDINFIPGWGEERIYDMIELRPDWCISRQRTWGVPIVALLCEHCGEAWQDPKWMHAIADKFETHPTGCDWWFSAEIEDIVPENLACPHCSERKWKRETDILDVWFDSGTSFAAVLEKRSDCTFPADLYMEGSDQHRGWFHSSLLASVGTRDIPPYKNVLTHGYVLDGNGHKMSKSLGNGILPLDVIKKFGADILRLWVSSVDYREDVRISEEILNRQVDAYRRIRNTCRYLLGNIDDFAANKLVPLAELDPLDRYALHLVSNAHNRIQEAYNTFDFHKFFHTMHNICVTDLSAFYLDVLKDRLYASGKDSKERRSAQTALYYILLLLVRDMAPVLSFTAEEIFGYIPETLRPAVPTVFALNSVDVTTLKCTPQECEHFEKLLELRAEVTKNIEPLRKAGEIGHSLDTHVSIYASQEMLDLLNNINTQLEPVFLVSQLSIKPFSEAPTASYKSETIEQLAVTVEKAQGAKCERCWIYSTELGTNAEHPTLCPRCTNVVVQK